MRLRFGIFPSPAVGDLEVTLAAVEAADDEGLDLVGVQDHPYVDRFLDVMTLITWLAAATDRVTFLTDVANLPLRPPAVLAKQAASIDVLTGGRFELGLGAGGNWDAISAFGGERRTPGEAVTATDEAIAVMRSVWGDGRRVDGEHYHLRGVRPGPAAPHEIPISIGAHGPRMLALIGRLADGWLPSLPFVPPDELAGKHAIIDRAAEDAGRDPSTIARMYNVSGEITDGPGSGFLRGPENQWVDQLAWLHEAHRIDTFILWPRGDVVDQVRRFAGVARRMRDSTG